MKNKEHLHMNCNILCIVFCSDSDSLICVGYYSYLYAKCFAATIWQNLCQDDPLSLSTGTALRTKVLQHGGAKEPADMLTDLVGDGILKYSNGGIVPDITSLSDEVKLLGDNQ